MSQLSPVATFLAGLQWLFFMFTNTVVIPLSVGTALQLPLAETTASVQRSFIYTGIACLLQAFLGHRYSLMEGQSGLWWGVILSLCATASASQMDLSVVGGSLSVGILLSGILIALLGTMGIGKVLNKIFTPIVMSVFLLLLTSQLILIFFKGMVGFTSEGRINVPIACLSFLLVFIVSVLTVSGKGLVSNFSILIGIVVGWIAYSLWFPTENLSTGSTSTLLILFPWGGVTHLAWGVVIMAILTGLINTTNTVATLRGAENIYETKMSDAVYKRSFIVTGFNSMISGLFGLVPYAPYASSIGFIQTTRIVERSAFVIGSFLFVILGSIPALGSFFSTLPISVGDAVLFVAYLQLFGSALRNIEGIRFNSKTIYRLAAPTLLGLAIMNLPATAFVSIHMYLRPLLSNGLLLGILVAIVLENVVNWSSYETSYTQEIQRKQVE
ncbi:MAG TPA: uracil/xanthine transporter [Bacillota bacterium]|nr:uracil/xanthine transporter [Bacillota bacterium]